MIIAAIQMIYRFIDGIRRKIYMPRIKRAKRKSRWDNSPNTVWNQEQNGLSQEQFYRDQLHNLDEQSRFQQEHQRVYDNMIHDHHHMDNFRYVDGKQ